MGNNSFEATRDLVQAATVGDIASIQKAINNGANLNGIWNGSYPLTIAALNGRYDVCKLLLNRGANVNLRLLSGGTALMLAAAYNHDNIVELLIANGADVNAKEPDGYTALRYAIQEGNPRIISMLKNAGAQL